LGQSSPNWMTTNTLTSAPASLETLCRYSFSFYYVRVFFFPNKSLFLSLSRSGLCGAMRSCTTLLTPKCTTTHSLSPPSSRSDWRRFWTAKISQKTICRPLQTRRPSYPTLTTSLPTLVSLSLSLSLSLLSLSHFFLRREEVEASECTFEHHRRQEIC
jgi:hypothetical protein